MSAIAETEHARSEQLDNPESIYRACADMKLFNQEVLRVILLDTRYRYISTVENTKGSINESLAIHGIAKDSLILLISIILD
jgi:DNA repair protein RadC